MKAAAGNYLVWFGLVGQSLDIIGMAQQGIYTIGKGNALNERVEQLNKGSLFLYSGEDLNLFFWLIWLSLVAGHHGYV